MDIITNKPNNIKDFCYLWLQNFSKARNNIRLNLAKKNINKR